MLATADLYGLAAVIAALGSASSAVISAMNRRTVKSTERKVQTTVETLSVHLSQTAGSYEAFRRQGDALLNFLRSIERTGETTGQKVTDIKTAQENGGTHP